ncbi:ExbD/TolR family protein [Endozoicomonadaceae bacterium StTr2]
MKFRRQVQQEVNINLTPLIDVVFLLLIFFMVSTTFTRETQLSIDLPQASGQEAQREPKQVEIVIGRSGDFAVNGRALVNSKDTTLKAAIESASGNDNTLPLIITADATTPYQAVVTAMDMAGQLGFVHISMTTRKPSGEDG